jgi:galactokinase
MSSDVSSSASSSPPVWREAAFVEAPEAFDAYTAPDPSTLTEHAHAMLVDRLGTADAPISTGYACGTIGVQADQTHYSDGFGLLMPLRQGTAVAVRRADTSRIVFHGDEQTWTPETGSPPPWVTAIHRIRQELLADQPVEVAVVNTIPGACRDASLAALAVALVRAVRALDTSTAVDLHRVRSLRDDLVPLLAGEMGAVIEQPYSTAYLLATFAGPEPAFTLVDTTTREHLPVETEARTALQWAVLDPGGSAPRPADFHRRRQEQADAALRHLRNNGFGGLDAFRDLEHRDLERAVTVLPEPLRPVARHLVTENRRVQKHVAAMRRSDWQMIGALLLMSHASQRDDWTGTNSAADAVVEAAETRTHDGLYGACMTGRSGAVLVTGRPTAFGQSLDHLIDTVEPTLGHRPRLLRP